MASQYRRRSLMLNTIAKVAQGNPTIITDSSSRRLKKLNIYGQSEQDSTTGKNLLNPTGATKVDWNIELPNFRLEVGKQYTYTAPILEGSQTCGLYAKASDTRLVPYIQSRKTHTFTVPEEADFSQGILLAGGSIDALTLGDELTAMVELGSVATEFEPYTGGKPSPSLDYPQEIISKEVSEIKVTGKNQANIKEFDNVFDGNTFEAHYENDKITYSGADDWSGCGIVLNQTFKKGQYTIQAKGVVMLLSDIALPSFEYNEYWNGKGYPYFYKFTQLNQKVSFNSDFPFKIGFVGGDIITQKSTVSGAMEQIQIELSSEATSYEPYKSQSITLSEPITLRGITVDNGGNVTIDGQQYIADYIDSLTGKVNRLNGYIDSYNGEEVGTIYMSTTGQLTTGAKVIYKLSQPTQEDLPQQGQEAIRALKTYYPNTVIQTGCWNEVTYSAKRGG